MNRIIITFHQTDIGTLIIGDHRGKLCLCDWQSRKNSNTIQRRIKDALKADFQEGTTPLLTRATKEVASFLEGATSRFGTPIMSIGTPFQQAVWYEIAKIPYGKTASYKTLAERIDKPKAVRAVAAAVGANALSLFIPCHRIIGSDGALRGYAGGVEAKKKLLESESQSIRNILS